jgi:hypothetical protein
MFNCSGYIQKPEHVISYAYLIRGHKSIPTTTVSELYAEVDDTQFALAFAGKRPLCSHPNAPQLMKYSQLIMYPRWSPLNAIVVRAVRDNFASIKQESKRQGTIAAVIKKLLLPLQEMQQFASARVVRSSQNRVLAQNAAFLSHCDYKTKNLVFDTSSKCFRVCTSWNCVCGDTFADRSEHQVILDCQ